MAGGQAARRCSRDPRSHVEKAGAQEDGQMCRPGGQRRVGSPGAGRTRVGDDRRGHEGCWLPGGLESRFSRPPTRHRGPLHLQGEPYGRCRRPGSGGRSRCGPGRHRAGGRDASRRANSSSAACQLRSRDAHSPRPSRPGKLTARPVPRCTLGGEGLPPRAAPWEL